MLFPHPLCHFHTLRYLLLNAITVGLLSGFIDILSYWPEALVTKHQLLEEWAMAQWFRHGNQCQSLDLVSA